MVKQASIIAAIILFSFNVNAQAKKDSTYLKPETNFLSLKAIDSIMQTKKAQISVSDWEVFYAVLNRMILPVAIAEFEQKEKIKSAAKKP